MNQKFAMDFYRMSGTKWKGSVRDYLQIMLRHNLRYMYLFRQYEQKKSLFARFRLYRLSRKYGLEISVNANMGEGIYLGHPYNITVAEGVSLGNNVNLHKGCTIGRENRGERAGVPRIGNNVYIGINATIVGCITIGDDVLIAPNSFVNRDVPSHCVVLGNPAVVYPKNNATESYVNFCI